MDGKERQLSSKVYRNGHKFELEGQKSKDKEYNRLF